MSKNFGKSSNNIYITDKYYELKLENSIYCIQLDYDDWCKARHCKWNWDPELEQPVNDRGITLVNYLGITGLRFKTGCEKYCFMRFCYFDI